jgi:hypothetical protein
MGASRPSYDLFNKHGRENFFSDLKRKRFQSLVWKDTFGRVICWIFGHEKYNAADPGEKMQLACRCCGKYLDG